MTSNNMREKFILSSKVALDVISDDSDDFEIVEESVLDIWRHGIIKGGIFKRLTDNKLFKAKWYVGINEGFIEVNTNIEFQEVHKVEKVILSYE
jgi:hypothetical protein